MLLFFVVFIRWFLLIVIKFIKFGHKRGLLYGLSILYEGSVVFERILGKQVKTVKVVGRRWVYGRTGGGGSFSGLTRDPFRSNLSLVYCI